MSAPLSAVKQAGNLGYAAPPIVGEGWALTDQQHELLAVASRLGREKFAPRAPQYDREATFPFENYDDLRAGGLLKICVPRKHGGLGADFLTYCIVAAELGRHCGATALTWNMHVCTTLWSGTLADELDMTTEEREEHERRRAIHFDRIVKAGKIYAHPFSESSAAAVGKAPFSTLATKVEGGWVLNGKKIFASLAGAADYYGILCTEDKPERSTRDTLYMAVPADAPGLSIVGDWDPLGMRATASRTLILKDVFVADDAQLLPRGVYYQAAMRWPHMFATLAPTYMGIAQAAYDFSVQYLRGEVPDMPSVKRRMYPTKQIALAEMRIKLEQTRALFLRAVGEAKVDPTSDERLRCYAAIYTVMENANDICRLGLRVCGGRSIFKNFLIERLYRDSRCGSLMLPWTAEICLERVGRESLFELGEK